MHNKNKKKDFKRSKKIFLKGNNRDIKKLIEMKELKEDLDAIKRYEKYEKKIIQYLLKN